MSGTTGTFSGDVNYLYSIGTLRTLWAGGYGGAVQLVADNATSARYSRIGIVDSTGTWAGGMTINNDYSANFTGSVAMSALTATTGGFSGNITSSVTNGNFFVASGATTNPVYMQLTNTSAGGIFGITGTSATGVFTGGTAYSTAIGTTNNTVFHIGTNNIVRLTIDSSGNVIIPDLSGSGNRCVYADSTGQINVKGFDCGSASGGDNLGDHTATQNILLGSNWLSSDGGNEGIRIDASGNVGVGTGTMLAPLTVSDTSGIGLDAIRVTSASHARIGLTSSAVNGDTWTTYSADDGSYQLYNQDASVYALFSKPSTGTGIFMNGSGDVGIGTTTPSAQLHINGTGEIRQQRFGGVVANTWYRANGTEGSPTVMASGDNIYQGIGYGYDGAAYRQAAYMQFAIDGTPGSSDMPGRIQFFTTPDGSATPAERMRIDNAGNVGIGTTAPTSLLHVSTATSVSASQTFAQFGRTTGANNGIGDFIGIGPSAVTNIGAVYRTTGSWGLEFQTNGTTTQMRIDNVGNVGIGTTGPGAKLDIANTVQASERIRLSGQEFYGPGQTDTNGVSFLMGVNRSNNRQLWIADSAATAVNTTNGTIWMSANTNGGIIGARATNGTTNMNLALQPDGGNVGIGTTAPNSLLVVEKSQNTDTTMQIINTNGGTAASPRLDLVENASHYLTLNALSQTYSGTFHGITAAKLSTIFDNSAAGFTNGLLIGTSQAVPLYFTTSSTERMRITGTGNVGIGTTSPLYKLHVQAAGTSAGSLEVVSAFRKSSAGGGELAFRVHDSLVDILSTYETTAANIDMSFSTTLSNASQPERMRIQASTGNVGIGTTSPETLLHIVGVGGTYFTIGSSASNASDRGLRFDNSAEAAVAYITVNPNTAGTDTLMNFYVGGGSGADIKLSLLDNSTVRFNQYGAGTLVTDSSGNITASSDERLKDTQGQFTKGLEAIRGLNPILYKWNTLSGMEMTDTYTGFSAQNVRDFIPEAVSTDSRGYYTLQDRPIMATAINAIKELDIKVQSLPTFENPTLASKVADFLRGIAEQGIAIVDSVRTNNVETKNIQTDTLCVGEVCVSQEVFLQMVQQSGNSSTPTPEEEPQPAEPTCSDGIQNQDETGIDEGGVCTPTPEPAPEPTPEPEPTPPSETP